MVELLPLDCATEFATKSFTSPRYELKTKADSMAVHIYPMEDWIEHQTDGSATTCNCPCNPSILYINPSTQLPFTQPLIIHKVLDGREIKNTDPFLGMREVDD